MFEYLPGRPELTEEEIIRLCLCHTSYLHKFLKLYIITITQYLPQILIY